MNIGKLSKEVGLPAKTIRFYEEIGLISKSKRSENGYRIYDPESIEEIQMVKYTRDLGLPILQIKKLMKGCKSGDCAHSKEYLIHEINEYLTVLTEKEEQMKNLKSRLNSLKKSLGNGNLNKSKYCCNILGQISNVGKGGEI